jgi:hypothetical protein
LWVVVLRNRIITHHRRLRPSKELGVSRGPHGLGPAHECRPDSSLRDGAPLVRQRLSAVRRSSPLLRVPGVLQHRAWQYHLGDPRNGKLRSRFRLGDQSLDPPPGVVAPAGRHVLVSTPRASYDRRTGRADGSSQQSSDPVRSGRESGVGAPHCHLVEDQSALSVDGCSTFSANAPRAAGPRRSCEPGPHQGRFREGPVP